MPKLLSKGGDVLLAGAPILLMLGLIPLVENDYLLTAIYIGIIALALSVKRKQHDLLALALGLFIMTAGETLFIATGVETFSRTSLFGIMPLWLPFLWAYGFVGIKRVVEIIRA